MESSETSVTPVVVVKVTVPVLYLQNSISVPIGKATVSFVGIVIVILLVELTLRNLPASVKISCLFSVTETILELAYAAATFELLSRSALAFASLASVTAPVPILYSVTALL